MKYSKAISYTALSRYATLFINLLIVVYTTYFWGSAGRGLIAVIITNISIINILTNITSGSPITYFSSKMNRSSLLRIGFLGALVLSLLGAIGFGFVSGWYYFINYFLISFLISATSSVSSYFLGKGDIKSYNLLAFLPSLVTLIVLVFCLPIIKDSTVDLYFYALYTALSISFCISLVFLYREKQVVAHIENSFDIDFNKILHYGFKNELSYFFQFLSFRYTYFIIPVALGLSELGVFSVAVSVIESVWVISRSISLLHYSAVINNHEMVKENTKATKQKALQSLIVSAVLSGLVFFVPGELFGIIFGKDFSAIKIVLLYLIPGTVAIAYSDIFGHFFSAMKDQTILIVKSIVGLGVLVVAIYFLLPRYEMLGICMSINLSYIVQSIVLVGYFHWKYGSFAVE